MTPVEDMMSVSSGLETGEAQPAKSSSFLLLHCVELEAFLYGSRQRSTCILHSHRTPEIL